MLISGLLSPRPTPTPTPASSGGGNSSTSGGTTPSGGTTETATPTATVTTAPSEPPPSSRAVQPTTAPPASGTSTSRPGEEAAPPPRAGADALRLYTSQLASGSLRPVPAAGTIASEVRRIESVEAAEITKSELIKQASVAMLAQANLRRQDVLDILNV